MTVYAERLIRLLQHITDFNLFMADASNPAEFKYVDWGIEYIFVRDEHGNRTVDARPLEPYKEGEEAVANNILNSLRKIISKNR